MEARFGVRRVPAAAVVLDVRGTAAVCDEKRYASSPSSKLSIACAALGILTFSRALSIQRELRSLRRMYGTREISVG
ncbi:hypothetical protein CC85DRAFT_8825 [Cutaneotrichosporon oleaginosum]|uniref:Uncharacterized protein n=1 Tax=Cutaneotrichosporon oleaginosum TaxID=879819 RepID=A0A0J1B9N7_9TREE|nr:uncharacterized protein CC85DRAFT_8825 [Cutaneotrichosporon oleaginosum]KLT44559.1 hypothetical protein CC85DRAFT_8825 [Cutaneotrichosporon oleaginosum]TXT13927.1 hypothetical protein COLE_00120 [Cutaneotrichosporon oleaginosum]